jgi:cell division septal protein FtsQ
MARRRRTVRPKTTARRRSGGKLGNAFEAALNFYVPIVFLIALAACVVWVTFLAYQRVTASDFFKVKNIGVYGIQRATADDVRRIMRNASDNSSSWNADLAAAKNEIEKLPWVKSAVVTRVLPDALRARVIEIEPVAMIRRENGEFWWVDGDARFIAAMGKNEQRPSYYVKGWNESNTDAAQTLNQKRVKLLQKFQEDLRKNGMESKIAAVSVVDLDDLEVFSEQGGAQVSISLGKEDFAKRLQEALKTLETRGSTQIAALVSHGNGVAVAPR